MIDPLLPHDTETQESACLATVCLWMDRRFWARRISTGWWDHIILEIWDDDLWLQNLRMRKQRFLELCEELTPTLQWQNTPFHSHVLLCQSGTIALWNLATPDRYQSVTNRFRVGKSTVGLLWVQVCKVINTHLPMTGCHHQSSKKNSSVPENRVSELRGGHWWHPQSQYFAH